MKTRNLILGFAALALAALMVAPAHAGDQDEPLGNVNKQKKSAKAKVVITDDDMPSTREDPAESKADDSSTGEKTPAKDLNSAELKKEIDSVRHDEELLKKKLEALRQKADEAEDAFRKQMYEDAIQNQQITLKELADERMGLERKLEAAQQKEKEKAKPQPES